jgi:hypothetical protein
MECEPKSMLSYACIYGWKRLVIIRSRFKIHKRTTVLHRDKIYQSYESILYFFGTRIPTNDALITCVKESKPPFTPTRDKLRTMMMIPQIQNALPSGTGWNRKMSAKIIPPRFPMLPTMPLMRPLESAGHVSSELGPEGAGAYMGCNAARAQNWLRSRPR